MRYDLPRGLTPRRSARSRSALDDYFGVKASRPDPWALPGRAEALGLGALQLRHHRGDAWSGKELAPFTWLGNEPRSGRGDMR